MNDDSNDTYAMGLRLWSLWTDMWNGKTEIALELTAPRFVLHVPLPSPFDPATITTPQAMKTLVDTWRARFDRIVFTYEAGPYVDTVAGVVAGPWSAEVTEAGKTRVSYGMDTVAFREGKIHEYWTLSKEGENVERWTKAISTAR